VPLETKRIPQLLFALEKRYPDAGRTTTDGLRLDWPGKWIHVRVSQTEPIVRIICEQRGGPPTALYEEVSDFVRGYGA
jgi:phosphomannomutase